MSAIVPLTAKDHAARMVGVAIKSYTAASERAALRCALGDAAALCDALAVEIGDEHRGQKGKGAVTKRGHELCAVAKRCGEVSSAVVRRDGGVTPTQSTAHLLGSEGMWMTVSERSVQYSVGDTIVVKIGKKATKLTVVAVYPKPRKARLAKSGPCKTKK